MFKGIITPVITIFDQAGKLDFTGNEAVINRLINSGVNGLLFLGSIGEFCALTMQEKKAFIHFAIKLVNKRVPVLVGTGGTVQEDVVELTRFAEQEGADGVVVISPYYFKHDDETIYRYYANVARSTSLPIILYNFPERTVSDLNPALVLRLAKDFSNIAGIKDTVDNVSHTRNIIRIVKGAKPDFSVLSGYDEYLVTNLLAGGDGVICGLTNVIPEVFVGLLKAFQANQLDQVAKAQRIISFFTQLYDVTNPFITAIKGGVALRGVPIVPVVKEPAPPITNAQMEALKNLLSQAGIEHTK